MIMCTIKIDENYKNPYNQDRIRVSKTRMDHNNNAHARARENRQARAEYTGWCSSSASQTANTASASAKFPLHQCNGKKSRALKASKGRVAKKA